MVYFRISCYETKRKVESLVRKTNYIATYYKETVRLYPDDSFKFFFYGDYGYFKNIS